MNLDTCCHLCRSHTGVCLTRWKCEHHIEAQKQDDANHKARRTIRDPTGDQATARADRARRKGK